MKTKRNGQIWTLDLIAGVVVFTIVIIVYFIFTNNISSRTENNFNDMYETSLIVSDSLISSGIPQGWNSTTVEEIGLTQGNYRINTSKLYYFKQIEYSDTKALLKTKYDYIFFFMDKSDNLLALNGTSYYGKAGITKDNLNELESPGTIISSTRLIIFNSSIITMEVYLWE